jgi:NTE family protein
VFVCTSLQTTSEGVDVINTETAPIQELLADRDSASPINLALQGGGSHGAFTWGVLDALLEDPRITFEGLSGSSAGALNAVVLADGWLKGSQVGGKNGGREGARQALADFWNALGQQLPPGVVRQGHSESISLSPASKMVASWAGQFSPYQLNPLGLNPLRDLLKRQIDFEALQKNSPFKLFVGTTQANTGKLRIFRENELSVDVLLASACLPKIHHAIEIDGEPYWDGGYSANPAVFPLFYDCDSADVLLVLLNPLQREGTLNTVEEIEARITDLAFSAHFMREMRMFTQATELAGTHAHGRNKLAQGWLEQRLQGMRFHMVDVNELTSLERSDTKVIAHTPFLELLREQGNARGVEWLKTHADSIGQRGTLDVKKWFG